MKEHLVVKWGDPNVFIILVMHHKLTAVQAIITPGKASHDPFVCGFF